MLIREELGVVEMSKLDGIAKPAIVVAKVSQEHLNEVITESSSSSYDSYKSSDEEQQIDEEARPPLTDKEKA